MALYYLGLYNTSMKYQSSFLGIHHGSTSTVTKIFCAWNSEDALVFIYLGGSLNFLMFHEPFFSYSLQKLFKWIMWHILLARSIFVLLILSVLLIISHEFIEQN